MKAGDLTELAVRNLRESLLRNSLTTLGVAVGVASLVAMLSLGVGLQQLANRRLAHSGLFDTVFVMSPANMNFRGFSRRERTDASTSNNSQSNTTSSSSTSNTSSSNTSPDVTPSAANGPREFRRLDEAARQEIEHLPSVIEVYPQVRFPTEVRYNSSPYATMVAGGPDSSRGNGSFDGRQGAIFSSTSAQSAISQIEFSHELADQPF